MTRRTNTRRGLAVGLSALTLITAGCSLGSSDASSPAAASGSTSASGASSAETSSGPGLSKVLFLGDSVAVGEALPLAAAFEAGGVSFESAASEGGGNVVGPFSDKNWEGMAEKIDAAQADVVVYQITTYDWGTRKQQRAAYQKLADTVAESGAKLTMVTVPPIKPDDFYQPHMKELSTTGPVARAVAQSDPEQVTLLDASEVWTDTYRQERDGKPDRSGDGIHTCPQGAARFAAWMLNNLSEQYPGFTPANPKDWANTGWSADEHFKAC